MASDLLLVREGTKLAAAEPWSLEAIEALAHGEQVIATIRRARNPQHHKKLFALLRLVVDNVDGWLDEEDLLDDIKHAMGYCRHPEGRRRSTCRPRSISFANMGQGRFEKFYTLAGEIILRDILPGVDSDDLERQVLEMVGS
jgi:hypothetical protein